MQRKTWAYGTTRRAKVDNVTIDGIKVTSVIDELGEGHILMGDCSSEHTRDGDEGTLEFRQGGPTGGYWFFTPDRQG